MKISKLLMNYFRITEIQNYFSFFIRIKKNISACSKIYGGIYLRQQDSLWFKDNKLFRFPENEIK